MVSLSLHGSFFCSALPPPARLPGPEAVAGRIGQLIRRDLDHDGVRAGRT
jgi:hypothetical protein